MCGVNTTSLKDVWRAKRWDFANADVLFLSFFLGRELKFLLYGNKN